jgi:hypothetical protein
VSSVTRRTADLAYPSKAYTAVRRAWDEGSRASLETENEEDEMTVIWRGSAAESQALVDAVEHNCTCEFWMDVRLTCCPAHRMLVEDQRALDGLLFARRIADRLRQEEWTGTHEGLAGAEAGQLFTLIGG